MLSKITNQKNCYLVQQFITMLKEIIYFIPAEDIVYYFFTLLFRLCCVSILELLQIIMTFFMLNVNSPVFFSYFTVNS